jgi:hypothetical protein
MKKTLLTIALAFTGFCANSQVIFSVEEPASIAGGYELTYAPNTDWGVPDLLITANAVLDTVVLAYDLTPTADSLMCDVAAVGSLTGKIAMLYRGDCEFGVKALNAQTAGAIAVIIINNISGSPVGMGGGAQGLNVTIPVVMVSDVTGALIKEKLLNGENVIAFIGNKENYYVNDIGTASNYIRVAENQAIPAVLAANSTEFPVNLGLYVFNYGSAFQTGSTVNAEITYNGTSIYNETSNSFDFVSGTPTEDSVWVDFPAFSSTAFSAGEYVTTYTLTPTVTDDYPADNVITTKFVLTDEMISLARLDANGLPTIDQGSKPSTQTGSFTTCIHFRNANASRVGAQGVYFGVLKNVADGDVIGEEILVQGYQWNDQFVDINDAGFAFDLLDEKGSGSYAFDADLQDTILYQAFDTPFLLEDDARYLFCATTSSLTIFMAYDTQTKYEQNQVLSLQPVGPIADAGTFNIGFEGDPVPSIGVKTFPAAEAGILETNTVEANVYPNPAKDQVIVSIKGYTGNAVMNVTDLAGKTVMNTTVSTDANGKVKVNTAELNNGMYIINLQMADGTVSKVNVVINK